MAKTITTRIRNKHDLEANWLKATSFIPMQGELIVYDIEVSANGTTLALPSGRTTPYTYERFKIGDGKTVVSNLPFTTNPHTHTVAHTPAGSVSSTFTGKAAAHDHSFTGTAHKHTFTGTAATSGKPDTTNVTTIYSITDVGTLPSATFSAGTLPSHTYTAPSHSYTAPSLTASVTNRCLKLSWSAGSHSFSAGSHSFSAGTLPTHTFSAGSLPTRSAAISMPNTNHTHSVTATGSIGDTTAGGTVGSKSITPAGSVSSSFSGTAATITSST